jgi:3',5'-cyclic-AMP phosphodiesterase
VITSPADERFITDETLEGHIADDQILFRAKAWTMAKIGSVVATLEGGTVPMSQIPQSNVWQGDLKRGSRADGIYTLTVVATDQNGQTAEGSIRSVPGASASKAPERSKRDQDNVVAAWPERGLLGTQLGPNKNGRKW